MGSLEGLRRPQDFDRKLTNQERQYIEDNLNIIHGVINERFKGIVKTVPYEDLFQEGYFGLHRAILTWNEKVKLSTRAYTNIQWEIVHYLNTKETPLGIYVPKNYVSGKNKEREMRAKGKEITEEIKHEIYGVSKATRDKIDFALRMGYSIDTPTRICSDEEEGLCYIDFRTTRPITETIRDTEEEAITNLRIREMREEVRRALEPYKEKSPSKYKIVKRWIETDGMAKKKLAKEIGMSYANINWHIKEFVDEFRKGINEEYNHGGENGIYGRRMAGSWKN